MFRSFKKFRKLKFEGDWVKLLPKMYLLRQSRTKYLEQNRKIQQNWTGQEKFYIYIYVFFNYFCQSLNTGRETVH